MIKNDFRPGLPTAAIPAAWLNTIANILNYLVIETTADQFPSIERTNTVSSFTPWKIKIPVAGGGADGSVIIPGKVELIEEAGSYRIVQKWGRVTAGPNGLTYADVTKEDQDAPVGYAFEHILFSHADEHADGVIKEIEE